MGRLRRERKKAERRDKRDRRKAGKPKRTLSESGAARRKSKSQTRTQRKSSSKPSLKLPTPDTRKPFPLGETKPAPKPTNEQAQADVADVKNRIAEQDIEVEKAQARVDNQRAIDERNARYNQQVALDEATIEQPGGWKNLTDINKIASLDTAAAFGKGALLGAEIGLTVVGVGAALKAASMAMKAFSAGTKVAKLALVGTLIPADRKLSIAKSIAVNSATKKATASWLRQFTTKATDPKVVGGAIMAMIGTYPFAYFVRSEAQTVVSIATSKAQALGKSTGNMDMADAAIKLQEEILDLETWEYIVNGIPFLNVALNVKEMIKGAILTLNINKQINKDLRNQIENGETDTEMYKRIATERVDAKEQERISDSDYYANLATQKAAAKAADRKADEKYYQGLIDKRDKEAKEKREADEDYWSQYYREIAKSRANSAPSNLKFGLL